MEHPDSTPPDETVLSTQIVERLLRFEDLSEDELAEIQANPSAQDQLHRLQLAEAWLTEPFSSEEAEEECSCPSAEDLFDYGQKLSSMDLSNRRKVELAEHLEQCPECSSLIATLAERPPSPLIVVDSPLPTPRQEPTFSPRSSKRTLLAKRPRALEPSGARHVPFLVAASLLAVLVVSGWPKSVLGKSSPGFPSPSIMRGSSALALISPRNLVLARTQESSLSPQLNGLPFETRAYPGAVSYEFNVFERGGSSLENNAQRASYSTMVESSPETILATHLPVGLWSWTAEATLESGEIKALGELDFRVHADEGLEEELSRLGLSVDAVSRLDWGHYHADARSLTRVLRDRGLCDSEEAARYLQELTP